jgi:hypothetical protein
MTAVASHPNVLLNLPLVCWSTALRSEPGQARNPDLPLEEEPGGGGIHGRTVRAPGRWGMANDPDGPIGKLRAQERAMNAVLDSELWRRERDSNPRGLGGPCGFQERRLTCCSVPSSVVVVTNLSRSVVVECRRIPSRAVAVGVWMGVAAGAQAAPGCRPTTAHEQGALRQKRRAALRRIGGALRGPLPCLSCCARLCDQRTSAWELAHRLPDQLEPLRRRPARPG